jgi:hypothetical protein
MHHSVAQELYQQQVAEWERRAEIRRVLRMGKQGRAQSSSPALNGVGRAARPTAQPLPEQSTATGTC